jgi:hypothetical protein
VVLEPEPRNVCQGRTGKEVMTMIDDWIGDHGHVCTKDCGEWFVEPWDGR